MNGSKGMCVCQPTHPLVSVSIKLYINRIMFFCVLYIGVCKYVCLYVCICVRIYVCVYVCLDMNIYMCAYV